MKNNSTIGSLTVGGAYVCWGLLTVFWNLLTDVNPVYILAHRITWSMLVVALLIPILGFGKEIKTVFKNPKALGTCFICGVLVTINWGVYIYAVNSGHVLDASLGYFLEPILVSLIGMLAFRERLGKYEKITFALSIIALVYIVVTSKTLPALALIIAGSFAIYGAVKKRLELSAQGSLFMETLCVAPLAIGFIVYSEINGTGCRGILNGAELLLLPACGVVTSVPLLMFNIGVKKIPYYVSGLLMYINPTLQFIMGLFYFNEPFDRNRLIAFIIIWIGVLFTVYEKIKLIKTNRLYTASAHTA